MKKLQGVKRKPPIKDQTTNDFHPARNVRYSREKKKTSIRRDAHATSAPFLTCMAPFLFFFPDAVDYVPRPKSRSKRRLVGENRKHNTPDEDVQAHGLLIGKPRIMLPENKKINPRLFSGRTRARGSCQEGFHPKRSRGASRVGSEEVLEI